MPFEVVEVEGKSTVPTALVSYERKKPRKGKEGKHYDRTKDRPVLCITIPTTICGTAKADAQEFLIGTGPDKGKGRIRPSTSAKAVKAHPFKHAMTWKFGFVPKLGDEAAAAERVLVRRISNEEFEIDLPAWFKW